MLGFVWLLEGRSAEISSRGYAFVFYSAAVGVGGKAAFDEMIVPWVCEAVMQFMLIFGGGIGAGLVLDFIIKHERSTETGLRGMPMLDSRTLAVTHRRPGATNSTPKSDVESQKMEVSVSSSETGTIDAPRSAIARYAKPQSSESLEQYLARLTAILTSFRDNGHDAKKLAEDLASALDGKKPNSYVNLACELAAAAHFLEKYPVGFRYQVPSHKKSSVNGVASTFDFSFIAEDYEFNVEVKAFSPKPLTDDPRRDKLFVPEPWNNVWHRAGIKAASTTAVPLAKHLEMANQQLLRPEKGLSVLLLSVNDVEEYADALTWFVGMHGICRTQQGVGKLPAPAELTDIDVVAICALGLQQSLVLDWEKVLRTYDEGANEHIVDGAKGWSYSDSVPAGLFLRPERPAMELQEAFGRAFESNHAEIFLRMQHNGNNVQRAVFDTFNNASLS